LDLTTKRVDGKGVIRISAQHERQKLVEEQVPARYGDSVESILLLRGGKIL
jgi:hypothetical protein